MKINTMAETVLRGTMRPSLQNSPTLASNIPQSSLENVQTTRMQQLIQRKTDLDKILSEKILLLQQLCRQESQVGAYIDDKTLRRKKYANSTNQQKDESCADTSNINRLKTTNVKPLHNTLHQQKLINFETGPGSPSHQQKHLLITSNANPSFNNKRYPTSTATASAAGTTLTSKNSIINEDARNNNLPSSSSLSSYAFYHQTSSPSPPPPIPPSLSSLVAGKINNNNSNKKQTLERRNSLISLNSQHRQPMHISVDDNIIISNDNTMHGSNQNHHTVYPVINNSAGQRSPAMIYQHYQQQNNSQQRKHYGNSTVVSSDTMSMLDNDIFIPSTTASSSKLQSKMINLNKSYHSPPIPSANVSHQMSPKSIKYVTGGGEDLSPHQQNHYSINNKQQYEWIETTGVKVPAMPITIATQPGLGGYWMQLENNERIWCSTDSKFASLDRKSIAQKVMPQQLQQQQQQFSSSYDQPIKSTSLGNIDFITKHDNSFDTISMSSMASDSKKQKEKQWFETPLDVPLPKHKSAISVVQSQSTSYQQSQQQSNQYLIDYALSTPPHHYHPHSHHHPHTLSYQSPSNCSASPNAIHQSPPILHREKKKLSSQSMHSPNRSYSIEKAASTTTILSPTSSNTTLSYRLTNLDKTMSTSATTLLSIIDHQPPMTEYYSNSPINSNLLQQQYQQQQQQQQLLQQQQQLQKQQEQQHNNSICSVGENNVNKNLTVIQPAKFQPYKEITKPFEMSDFYKYSTKFRQKTNGPGGGGGRLTTNLSNQQSNDNSGGTVSFDNDIDSKY